jgi:hypothetical protein
MPRSGGFFLFVFLALLVSVSIDGPNGAVRAQGGPEDPSAVQLGTQLTAPATTANLTGTIIAAPGGRPFRNVEVTLLNISSGATLRTHTDVRGHYQFHGIVMDIDYVITPWKPGYVFTPGALVITPTAAASAYDFTARVDAGFFAPFAAASTAP